MKIEVLETFLDGPSRYEAGEVRVVSDEDGAHFCAAGWAKDLDGAVPTAARQQAGEVRLDVRNVLHGQGVGNG